MLMYTEKDCCSSDRGREKEEKEEREEREGEGESEWIADIRTDNISTNKTILI